jgi:YidC/Oxa1 family membrane protein insertase
MERKTALAIVLMLIVALLPSILSPPEPPPAVERPDSLMRAAPDTAEPAPPVETAPPVIADRDSVAPLPRATAAVVESPLYRFTFSSRGARLIEAVLKDYRSFAPGDSGLAQLMPRKSRFLEYALVFGRDTVPLGEWTFVPSDTLLEVTEQPSQLEWIAERGPARVRLVYRFEPDDYVFDVEGRVEGIDAGGLLLVRMGPGLRSIEADSAENIRSYAIVTKANNTASVGFGKLEPGQTRVLDGPFEWVAVKSKYFVVALMVLDEGQPQFGGVLATGGPRLGKHAINADVVATLPLPAAAFAHSVYVGPQEFHRLSRVGHDFEDINPYGWIFRPIIMPFANLIVRILLWMHETLNMHYGWALVVFGIAVRVLLWPLNQKAMRSSMAMQAIQPEIKAVQERYKKDQQKMQQEVMKLYKEHNVNPVGGCLPLLLPTPVLFALFFVFRETIEFRGVPFLWLPDLSRPDPIYIIPILMGLSMYAVMKLGQRGIAPNPQMKMMLYVMPVFLTVIFLNFSAGLNLYYAVSNIASIPQQWLIARERQRRTRGSSKKSE